MDYGAAQTGRIPHLIYADKAEEYIREQVRKLMKYSGDELRATIPYNPEENGIAERFNRTLLEGLQSVLFSANLDD